jgi:hypothetical protein
MELMAAMAALVVQAVLAAPFPEMVALQATAARVAMPVMAGMALTASIQAMWVAMLALAAMAVPAALQVLAASEALRGRMVQMASVAQAAMQV